MLILKSRCIFDSVSDAPFEGYVVIEGSKIAEVGRGQPPPAADWTQICDCGDKTVMPGFCDNHVHVYPGALALTSVNVRETKSEDEAARMLYAHYKDRTDTWALGFGWLHYKW